MLAARRLLSSSSTSSGLARVGDVGRATRTFSEADVAAFAQLTHDDNPIHDDAAFAAAGRFGQPVVHGMLYASMFGAIVGHRCPGAVYLSQTLQFRKPVHLGDTLTAEIEVSRVGGGGRLLDFLTRCTNQSTGELVLDGEARVMMPREKKRPS
jgi:acyl dehydratase